MKNFCISLPSDLIPAAKGGRETNFQECHWSNVTINIALLLFSLASLSFTDIFQRHLYAFLVAFRIIPLLTQLQLGFAFPNPELVRSDYVCISLPGHLSLLPSPVHLLFMFKFSQELLIHPHRPPFALGLYPMTFFFQSDPWSGQSLFSLSLGLWSAFALCPTQERELHHFMVSAVRAAPSPHILNHFFLACKYDVQHTIFLCWPMHSKNLLNWLCSVVLSFQQVIGWSKFPGTTKAL